MYNHMNEPPEAEMEPELDDNDIRWCFFCCWRRNNKTNKKVTCSKCCNRKIILQRSINRLVKTFSRHYTD